MREHASVHGIRSITLAAVVSSAAGVTLAHADPAHADPAPVKAPAAPATTASTPDASRPGALSNVAQEIARNLGPREGRRLVVAGAITSDLEPLKEKADALAVRVAQLIAGASGGRAHDRPQALATARGLAKTEREVVYVQLELQKGVLAVTADVYPVVRNGWERLKGAPASSAHAFARAPIDAEVRSCFQPLSLEKLTLRKAKLDETDVIGLGCGDPDGGGTHLFLVTRERITRGRIDAGKFVAVGSERFRAIAKRSPTPLREPFANVVVGPRGHAAEVWIRSTDFDGVRLDGALRVLGSLPGMPIPFVESAACATVNPEFATLDPRLERCTASVHDPKVDLANLGASTGKNDRLYGWSSAGIDGSPLPLTILAREPNGALRVTTSGASQTLDNVGGELALGDMNLDGEPEIAFAADRGDDAIRLVSVTSRGIVDRARWAAPEGVRAMTFCPPEANGAPALAAVVGKEVWLAR